MGVLSDIGGFLGSVLSGGVTGILGVAVQRVADYKNKQLDLQAAREKAQSEIALKQADAAIMAQEWAARTKIAETEAAGQEAVADSQAFAASFNEPKQYAAGALNPAQTWLMVVLDFVRGIVRPGLTIYLCVLTTLVYFQAREIQVRTGISSEEAYAVVKQVTSTILYLATTCLLWWFGVRNKGGVK